MFRKSLPLFIIVLFISSCTMIRNTTNTSPGQEPLFLSKWTLDNLHGSTISIESQPYLLFTAGETFRVSGFAGCNLITGGFTLSGVDSIDFGEIASTLMACPQYATEQDFLTALQEANRWMISGGQLFLLQGSDVVASFTGSTIDVAEEAGNMAVNGTWELSYISGPRIAFDALYPQQKPTLVISMPNTKATGNSGCNSFSVDVKIKDKTILFGPIAATKMYCEGSGESTYFDNLGKVDTWQMDDNNNLALMIGDVVMMRFIRK